MSDIPNLIQPCTECDHGTVVLFTSSQRCRKCSGTGFVSDDSLAIPIASLPTSVRLRNSLAKSGIKTLGHLACVAAAGRAKDWAERWPVAREEAKQLLLKHGLWIRGDAEW